MFGGVGIATVVKGNHVKVHFSEHLGEKVVLMEMIERVYE